MAQLRRALSAKIGEAKSNPKSSAGDDWRVIASDKDHARMARAKAAGHRVSLWHGEGKSLYKIIRVKGPKRNPSLADSARACLRKANVGGCQVFDLGNQVSIQVNLPDRYPPPSLIERVQARVAAALRKCGLYASLTSERSADGYAYIKGAVHAL